ncbi:hypothetical protein FSARC_599 [Fusarium sarcochroum]|uniref:DUF3295 domain-containing protein n=1 Tax=Fusarium sarcochroum TaxID=1208366 RepID=A0A8H4XF98_9HYPO|nr:hypothetical protein FSARC_599 [Fusarium sarcochroum]
MPYCLDTHVFTADANAIRRLESGNSAKPCSRWTVSSQYASSVEQSRRPENICWSLGQREAFVTDSEEKTGFAVQVLAHNVPSEIRRSDTPKQSGSVEPLIDEEAFDLDPVSAPFEITRPRVRLQYSYNSTWGECELHTNDDGFEKVDAPILENKGPLLDPPQIALVSKEPLPLPPASEYSGPTTIAHNPGKILEPETVQSKRSMLFVPGGPSSSNEQDRSLTNNKPDIPIIRKPIFQIGGSFKEDGFVRRAMARARPGSLPTSKDILDPKIDGEAAVDSDADDFIDEGAIDDDDDSSDWEDSMDESGKSSMIDDVFHRVDIKPGLSSHRSLVTLMLARTDRVHDIGNHASQSTPAVPRFGVAHGTSLCSSPNDPDEAPLIMKGMRGPGLKLIHEVPRSNAQPVMIGPNYIQSQAVLSPRTTRRNMLATELTESLRRHLLWERQQKSSTANAVLKRRHTSHDVASLKQYPEKPCMKKSENVNASDWNQYFSKEALGGYHSKRW